MIIHDKVHDKLIIEDPIVIDLINSAPMQRLKKISQDGASHFLQPIRTVTRFEHSVGVWYLSYKYNRSIEEQIACLLHDIPHTAFSHVIDSVVKDDAFAFHERFMESIIMDSKIPGILKKHNIDIKKVLDVKKFPLLENSLPDISVDRWDYFIRDGYGIGFLPKSIINDFLENIKVDNDIFYFTNLRLASTYAILFMNFSRLIWLDPNSCGSYTLLSNVITKAYDLNYISQDDFFTDDEVLLNKLREIEDEGIQNLLKKLTPSTAFEYTEIDKADFVEKNKPRFVDPFVKLENGKLERVSNLVPSLKYAFKEFKDRYGEIGVVQI